MSDKSCLLLYFQKKIKQKQKAYPQNQFYTYDTARNCSDLAIRHSDMVLWNSDKSYLKTLYLFKDAWFVSLYPNNQSQILQ